MTTPYTPSPFIQITPSVLPQTPTPATRGRGAKRGRKPRGAALTSSPASHQANAGNVAAAAGASVVSMGGPQFTPVQWTSPTVPVSVSSTPIPVSAAVPTPTSASQPITDVSATGPSVGAGDVAMDGRDEAGPSTSITMPPGVVTTTLAANSVPTAAGRSVGTPKPGAGAGDEDGEGEDEVLPAMADDDYSAQLSWQSESKDNLKCVFTLGHEKVPSDTSALHCRVLMDKFSPAQYDRFEAYRRHALPKQAVRRVGATAYMFFSNDESSRIKGNTSDHGTTSLSAYCSNCRWLRKGVCGRNSREW